MAIIIETPPRTPVNIRNSGKLSANKEFLD
jgi:hypothetical protein